MALEELENGNPTTGFLMEGVKYRERIELKKSEKRYGRRRTNLRRDGGFFGCHVI